MTKPDDFVIPSPKGLEKAVPPWRAEIRDGPGYVLIDAQPFGVYMGTEGCLSFAKWLTEASAYLKTLEKTGPRHELA